MRTGLLVGRLEFLRAAEKERVAGKLDRPEDWSRITPADLETWIGRPIRALWDPQVGLRRLVGDLRFLERPATGWLHRRDPGFPAALAEIADPPWGLWFRGAPPGLDRSWVAVVGTRMPSEAAKRAAWALGQDLGRQGVVVVSGLARGIDAQAHGGALESGTVAVLGHGIDTISPAGHHGLARRIVVGGGTLLSEYGPGEPAFGYRFVERNRIISGLSRTVVVVQAPRRSGALWTADFALEQGRDVVVHRAGVEGDQGAGTLDLARQGAPVIAGASELVQMWNEGSVGWSGAQSEFDWGKE